MIDHGIEIAKLFNKFFADIAKNIKNIYGRTKCNFERVEWSEVLPLPLVWNMQK